MKLSVFSLVFVAALFCSSQLATAAIPRWAEACSIFDPQNHSIFCRPPLVPVPGNEANASTGNGTAAAAAAENATEGSTGAVRSLPIFGSGLPIDKLLPIR